MLNTRMRIALLTYSLLVSILFTYPPVNIGDTKGQYHFGIGPRKTVLPLWLLLLIIAFISYIVSLFF